MNRKQRRIQKRRVRRVGIVVASVAMLGATAGLSGAAFAGGTDGAVYGGNGVQAINFAIAGGGGGIGGGAHAGASASAVNFNLTTASSYGAGTGSAFSLHLNVKSGNYFCVGSEIGRSAPCS